MCVSPLSPYASLDHVGAVAAGGVDGHLVEHLGERDARRAVVLLGELGVVDGRRLDGSDPLMRPILVGREGGGERERAHLCQWSVVLGCAKCGQRGSQI